MPRLASIVLVQFAIVALAAAASPTTQPTRPDHVDVAAIYFPGYHHDSHYDTWFGPGWNEWKLMLGAKPRFPGQHFLQPEWGAFDETDPAWMARQIDLAADHAIDAFVFDWYWYSGTKILHRPLEEGFLKAGNRSRLKFGLMWANHPWRNYFPAPLGKQAPLLLPAEFSPADFERVMGYCIEHYFREPNYWRVSGGLYFGIFDDENLIKQLGGPEKTREVFDRARKQIASAGLGKLHLAAFDWAGERAPMLRDAGFDSTTMYNITSSGKATLPDRPLDEYKDVVEHHVDLWKQMDTGVLPYAPVVTVGWDPSPRWVPETPFPPPSGDYPYTTLVVHNTPELFGRLCRLAREHVRTSRLPAPAILVNAWNEWTEGSALLPDRTYKTEFLSALKASLAEPARPHCAGRELFVPGRPGVRVGATAFYTRAEGLELSRRVGEQTRSDTTDVSYRSFSSDNGRTWSPPERIETGRPIKGGVQRRYQQPGWVDPGSGLLINIIMQADLPGDRPIEGMKHWTLRYAVSRDGGRSFSPDVPIIHQGSEYSEEHPLPGVWLGRNAAMIGDTTCVPIRLRTGEMLVSVQITPLGPDGQYYNPGGGYTYHDAAVLIGRWASTNTQPAGKPAATATEQPAAGASGQSAGGASGQADGSASGQPAAVAGGASGQAAAGANAIGAAETSTAAPAIEWELSQLVKADPKRSTRGMIEPTLAEMPDGRVLMVMRGSNDAKGTLPGYRWYSVSSDSGRSWTQPQPWTYAGGESFFSPSSCSQLIRHTSGRLYWIGNVSPSNPRGNAPRYPLVIGEVDPTSLLLRKETICTLDDYTEGDADYLSFSNFYAREDRATHDILVHCSPVGQHRAAASGPNADTSGPAAGSEHPGAAPHAAAATSHPAAAKSRAAKGIDWTADAYIYRVRIR